MLAMAGLPIYIHAPKFYVDSYGVGLAALGAVLAGLRLIDVVQDPVLGWLAQRVRRYRGASVMVGGVLMAVSMVGLFAVPPPLPPVVWFGLTLTGLFSGFSFLTITFYAQGVQKADVIGAGGHVRLATWRETGALLGVCIAAVAPTVLIGTGAPFALFAWGFVGLAALAVFAMAREWQGAPVAQMETGLAHILRDRLARRLLLIALVNATPVAVTSTLFLFFVESRLAAPGAEGPLLLLFFLSAAVSAPLWGRIAVRIGAKRALLAGMGLAILSFGYAAFLGAGDVAAFAVICFASGVALGADLTLLPAIFATRMAQIAPNPEQGFGLWSFVTKVTLAIAALTLLPVLEFSGFQPGQPNAEPALFMLTALYAVLPCVLKFLALALFAGTTIERG
ncbi:MFS transporter [Oceaniglobus ichthyenteri]|uniref:MFS transporter n=1 Tax=Oceaniglobus ichthyenteri TaxID=2136177 RepID=UPI000D370F8C|nr:MFS transporter [Oceaniglobus ichthyenteri]